uniref:Uncharacterized protein n=1 Tax=Pseudellipsoidion edaphicum TaxID=1431838 RepID=A0A410D2L4_9STRA|nr:hypothetical protein [Pseudellipsoidion edaphicum]QAA11964.1 hypothetical protein [Pseudellipsoidion edaphicum]
MLHSQLLKYSLLIAVGIVVVFMFKYVFQMHDLANEQKKQLKRKDGLIKSLYVNINKLDKELSKKDELLENVQKLFDQTHQEFHNKYEIIAKMEKLLKNFKEELKKNELLVLNKVGDYDEY